MSIKINISSIFAMCWAFLGLVHPVLAHSAYSGDETIYVAPNQSQFVIRLSANPTTGYQWNIVSYDKQLLTQTGAHYQRPNNHLIGAGGQMIFQFKINQNAQLPNRTQLSFTYARPWESQTGTNKRITVIFKK